MGLLDKKVAFVTGAAGGLGMAIVKAFVDEGAFVVASVHRIESAKVIAEEFENSNKIITMVTDVTNEQSVSSAVAETVTKLGHLDILVNNAGIIVRKSLIEHTIEDWEKVMAVDLTGTFLCSKHAAIQMIKQEQGKIINIASIAGLTGYAYPSYGASKGGVVNLTRGLAWELGPQGITVNCISPGLVLTNLNKGSFEDQDVYSKVIKKIPARRLGLPEEVARCAVFLASEQANYLNGTSLTVDGGTISAINFFED